MTLVGDNSLLDELRIMTSVELFLNSSFYIKHPVLIAAFEKHGVDITRSFNNLLPFISSFESTSRFDVPEDIIKNEAILNCHDKQWCSFLCMLGLSSAISVNISSYYPDCGLEKYKLLFNCKIEPREVFKRTDEIHILFCFNGTVKTGDFFTPNHFVPLIVEEIGNKRKQNNVSSVTVKKPFPSESFVQSKLSFWTITCSNKLIFPKLKAVSSKPKKFAKLSFKNESSQY